MHSVLPISLLKKAPPSRCLYFSFRSRPPSLPSHFLSLPPSTTTSTPPSRPPSCFIVTKTKMGSTSSCLSIMSPRAMDAWVPPRARLSSRCVSALCVRFAPEKDKYKDQGFGSASNMGSQDPTTPTLGSHLSDGRRGGDGGLDPHRDAPKTLLTLPTILTIARVVAVPLLVTTFYMNAWWATTATTSLFVMAAVTDWLDGYIARKMRLGTTFGAFLDPVADKLMVATTLVLLCTKPLEVAVFGQLPWLLTVPSIAIIGREITMSAVREWAASQNSSVLEAVAVNNLGKWKTAAQMTALTILLATRDNSLSGVDVLVPSGVGLLYISAGLSVWSLIVYIRKIARILLK